MIEGLQREIAVRGKAGFYQGGLAGLLRAGEGDHRTAVGIAEQVACEKPVFWGRASSDQSKILSSIGQYCVCAAHLNPHDLAGKKRIPQLTPNQCRCRVQNPKRAA